MEYRFEVELEANPSICGKMYQIQCVRFRPLLSSESAHTLAASRFTRKTVWIRWARQRSCRPKR